MTAEMTKQEALELLDLMIKVAIDPDSVDAQVLEATWPDEKIAMYLEAIRGIVAESKAFN
jgi:hypothetical protein